MDKNDKTVQLLSTWRVNCVGHMKRIRTGRELNRKKEFLFAYYNIECYCTSSLSSLLEF